jgi:glycine hydroxymethyltransferase
MLKKIDRIMYNLIKSEQLRQRSTIELIASENLTSKAVLECLGSCLTNKYSEGQPNRRYYGGNDIIDKIELLCKERAKKAFNLNQDWHINVQPYSGTVANIAVYTGLINPGDKIMGMDLSSGGHLSHGFKTDNKKISASSLFFESKSYKVNNDGYLDYNNIMTEVKDFKPNILICGASSYPRDINYQKFREIADSIGCLLMADISHINGFIVTGLMNDPFKYCDVVTTTTHKTLRGPRSAIIFCKEKFKTKIDEAVFPGMQGGPHNHQIAAVATQLHQVTNKDFYNYMVKVRNNAKYLCEKLKELDFKFITGGTDNHILLIDLRNFNITGSKMEKVCDKANISLNKNSINGDKSALSPSGIRLGLNTLTTREIDDCKLDILAILLREAVDICIERQETYGKKMIDFTKDIDNDKKIKNLKDKISELALALKYPEY